MDPSITILTGGYNIPRRHIINYESNPPKKYALLHIRIRNDDGPEDARKLYIYYSDHIENFIEYIYPDKDDIDHDLIDSLLEYNEIWIDEWVRRRNGDSYRLYEITDIENETPKMMLRRIQNEIRGADENHFDLSEYDIYHFDDMDAKLPNTFEFSPTSS